MATDTSTRHHVDCMLLRGFTCTCKKTEPADSPATRESVELKLCREVLESTGHPPTHDDLCSVIRIFRENNWFRLLIDAHLRLDSVASALRNLMKAVTPELTGKPKNVRKSTWAKEWDEAERALAALEGAKCP